jgi:hypothetical protein
MVHSCRRCLLLLLLQCRTHSGRRRRQRRTRLATSGVTRQHGQAGAQRDDSQTVCWELLLLFLLPATEPQQQRALSAMRHRRRPRPSCDSHAARPTPNHCRLLRHARCRGRAAEGRLAGARRLRCMLQLHATHGCCMMSSTGRPASCVLLLPAGGQSLERSSRLRAVACCVLACCVFFCAHRGLWQPQPSPRSHSGVRHQPQ